MSQVNERVERLPFCGARLGQPCNIIEIGNQLIARIKLNEGVTLNTCGGDWQAIANDRHHDTNYENLLEELPKCWASNEDGAPCAEREMAYGLLKLEARYLVEPISKYRV